MRRGRLKWFEGGEEEEATADGDEDGDGDGGEESGKI